MLLTHLPLVCCCAVQQAQSVKVGDSQQTTLTSAIVRQLHLDKGKPDCSGCLYDREIGKIQEPMGCRMTCGSSMFLCIRVALALACAAAVV